VLAASAAGAVCDDAVAAEGGPDAPPALEAEISLPRATAAQRSRIAPSIKPSSRHASTTKQAVTQSFGEMREAIAARTLSMFFAKRLE
jgi:hypothetical protein